MTPAVAVALAVLFGLSGNAGVVVLMLAVVLVQVLIVPAWGGLVRAPGAASTVVVAGLAAAGADVAVRVSQQRGDAAYDGLAPLAGALGLAVVGAFSVQLLRRPGPGQQEWGRSEVVASLTRSVSAAVVAALVASWLSVLYTRGGTVAVTAGALGCAVAAVAFALPLPAWAQTVVSVVLAAAGGLVVGRTASGQEMGGVGPVAVVAVVVALVALVAAAVGARGDRPPLTRLALPSALLPMALAGPVVYLAAQVVLG